MARGRKTGGRQKGVRNKATIEREKRAQIERERLEAIAKLEAEGANAVVAVGATREIKLAKDVLEDFMRLYAGMAAAVQPLPAGAVAPPGHKPDPVAFREWADRAVETAKALVPYQSPRLSAVMVGQQIVNEIEIIGGLPDEQDGSFIDVGSDGPIPAQGPAGELPAGADTAADAASRSGEALPDAGQAEGGPVRKAVG